MIRRFIHIMALVSLLVFQSWVAVSAAPEAISLESAAAQLQMDEHDCCDDESQAITCEIHCFSALSALVSNMAALVAAAIPANLSDTANFLIPSSSPNTVYRPPIA